MFCAFVQKLKDLEKCSFMINYHEGWVYKKNLLIGYGQQKNNGKFISLVDEA